MIRKHASSFRGRRCAASARLAHLIALASLWAAPIASAQLTAGTGGTTPTTPSCTGGIACQLISIGSDKYTDTSYKTPVNKAQCDANAELHLSLTTIPMNFKLLEVWVGDNCMNGDRATRLGTTQCSFVRSKDQDPTNTIDTDFTIPVSKACELGDGSRTFWILPVTAAMGSENVATYARLTLTIDQTPPAAPSSVKGGAGQTEIKVSWTQPSDSYYFWVVVDTDVGTDAGNDLDAGPPGCVSANLRGGAVFDPENTDLPDSIWVKHINEKASSMTLSGEDFGITMGHAAVAVIAEDLGRNRSVLSSIACLDIVPTKGFWESYRDGGGTAEAGCACTVPGATSHGAPRTAYALGALGLIWSARRRVRRRA